MTPGDPGGGFGGPKTPDFVPNGPNGELGSTRYLYVTKSGILGYFGQNGQNGQMP